MQWGRGGGGERRKGALPEAAVEGEAAAESAERKREGEGTPTKTTVCDCALTTADPAVTVVLRVCVCVRRSSGDGRRIGRSAQHYLPPIDVST